MKILITGACGFAGSSITRELVEAGGHALFGLDNFIRPGSESNRADLKARGVRLFHGDIRCTADLAAIPAVDWVIDAAANASVLAGVDGKTSSRQLVEHNLIGTVNMLEFCRQHHAGFTLLSSSRIYSIPGLANLPVEVHQGAFRPDVAQALPAGITAAGIDESYSTQAPVSLYGATKVASEALALEYGATFGFPVLVNRCGVMAGAGQFGRPDQGIFAYWINGHRGKRPLQYIGFDGRGHQVRDCLHPRDLISLLDKQMAAGDVPPDHRIVNVSGGPASAMSLCQLTAWCDERFGPHDVSARAEPRQFDIPWMVLDSGKAERVWGWTPATPTRQILEEIAAHAQEHPDWLDLSAPF